MYGSDDNNDRRLPKTLPHTGSIWTYYMKEIFDASQYYNDTNHIYHDFISELIKFMTPIRMSKSSKSLPYSNYKQIENILHIIYNRYVYVHNQMNNPNSNSNDDVKSPPPRKLNIIVLGGSVTIGAFCELNPIQTTTEEDKQRYPPMDSIYECSWAVRLQEFLNKLLKGNMTEQQQIDDDNNNNSNNGLILDTDIIKVYNVAVGGRDTSHGNDLWDYSLLPDDVITNPDIILTAYSTNDSIRAGRLVNTENPHANEMYLHDMIQTYIRTVLSKTETYYDTTCNEYQLKRKPLLLFYDEYMGYNKASIYTHVTFNRIVSMLSKYYGVGYISYSDTMRDLYYSNTHQTWFTPSPAAGPHFGQGMHITSMWIISYTILDYITSYCSSNTIRPTDILQNDKNKNNLQYNDIPKKKPLLALPPPISWDYNIDNISNIWNRYENERQINDTKLLCQQKLSSNTGNIQKSCLFDIGRGGGNDGPSCCPNNTISYNNGWIYSEDHNKPGFVPHGGINSTFIMNFLNISQSVNVLNIVYMISYGSLWENSYINMTTSVLHHDNTISNILSTTNIYSALNDQETSISMDHKAYIIANIGDTIIIQFKFIAGITFKLIGLALCDHR